MGEPASAPRPRPVPLRVARTAEGDLDALFDGIVDTLRRDVRRLQQQVTKFERAYQRKSSADDEATRRAFRRLRQLQLVVDHIGSSAAFLGGSGIAPERRTTDDHLALERRMLESLEAERERLVREVHDGPAQVLANAIFELEYLDRMTERLPVDARAGIRTEIGALKTRLRSSLEGVRAMIYDLRPPVLSELGLAGAMRAYLAEYEARYGLKVLSALEERETGFDPQQELAVYRIMQEALQNTQKHARATSVRVEWERDGPVTWVLRCTDDGSGFDIVRAARQARSVGLLSMRERAELIGGTFDLRSAPAQGTTVTVRIDARRTDT
jgi:two-component system, NarL family, sensor histidine kinase DegS